MATKLTAADLRVGNYYNHNGEVRKVSPNTIEEVWYNPREWCKPIPLTEEWLIKFGFKHTRAGLFGNNYMCNGVSLQLKGFEVYMFVHHARCEIKYVHQLQNLYYALTNTELTINEDNQ